MKKFLTIAFCCICFALVSCKNAKEQLTKVQIEEITKSATAVVKKVFEYSNLQDFETGLTHYSASSDSYFITDGIMHSLGDLKKSYREIGPSVEVLHNTIESWNTSVLSKDVVIFTLPVQLKLKLRGLPEYNGKLIWTATVQKQNDEWKIVQSHESWLNCAQVAAALTAVADN
ncbi:hypothetical protein [Muriicola sp. Z0-33]|uniref:hypothetical protein n=1 Tax=Muriicola sp. Z0-33 TaxID=2816957 RepID=UPI002238E69E|nr:hypothetical protein [Muriicola sp. Z0-33]MCW5516021.1 nuclear transport factor 2 family protein [Muriicola sp. Z0-33]